MTASSADEVMADGVLRARPRPDQPELGEAWRRSSWIWRVASMGAVAAGLVMAVLGHVPLASGCAVAVLVPAALIDAHHRRLPNRWVGSAAATFAAASIVQLGLGEPLDATDAALGAIVVAGPMLALHLLSPTAMGFGDVKAGIVLGASLGAIDWQLALAGLALAAGATSIVAIIRNRSVVAFGPGLVAGSLVALGAHTSFVVAPDRLEATPDPPVVEVVSPDGAARTTPVGGRALLDVGTVTITITGPITGPSTERAHPS